MTLPGPLIESLAGIPGFDAATFTAVHESGEQVTSVRLNPAKGNIQVHQHLPIADCVPWSSNGYYLSTRPSFTFDPLFHAGAYYVQEASSMFVEQALKQSVDLSQPLRVLDLCAAPGGKSTLLQSLISPESLLVSNDVIKSRAAVLEENLSKWGSANVVVTNNDPSHFARLENFFDVMVVDAPCSGSGLFRRDADAIEEWSENNVKLCSQRQQRIIADVWPALKQDGVLIYSTCSYSKEEDEDLLDWIVETMGATTFQLKTEEAWRITETQSAKKQAYGYRFYPDKVKGEGFFIAVLHKNDGSVFSSGKPGKQGLEKPAKTEEAIIRSWLREDASFVLVKQKDDVLAIPAFLETTIPILQSALYIKKAGFIVGKMAGKDLVPDHQLAVSNMVNKKIARIAMDKQQAIQYLRRNDMHLDTPIRGWALVEYEGEPLGWIKVLPNRFNNYYPREWRITKQFQ